GAVRRCPWRQRRRHRRLARDRGMGGGVGTPQPGSTHAVGDAHAVDPAAVHHGLDRWRVEDGRRHRGDLQHVRLRHVLAAGPRSETLQRLPQRAPGSGGHPGDGRMKDQSLKAILDLDRVVHEPARLAILTVLSAAEEVEFLFLLKVTGLSKGNLSAQAQKLEAAGYLQPIKPFRARVPVTSFRMTDEGRSALLAYHAQMRALLPGRK